MNAIRIVFTYRDGKHDVQAREDHRSPAGKAQARRIKQRVC